MLVSFFLNKYIYINELGNFVILFRTLQLNIKYSIESGYLSYPSGLGLLIFNFLRFGGKLIIVCSFNVNSNKDIGKFSITGFIVFENNSNLNEINVKKEKQSF